MNDERAAASVDDVSTDPVESAQDALDRLARTLFESYKRHRVRDGQPVEYVRFGDQPADLQASSRAQAASLWEKAAALGCAIVPASEAGPNATVLAEVPEDEVECLARAEHDRWVAERAAAGWTYAPVKDVEARTSPFLVPYEELTEEVRDYDRQPVREMPQLLADAGYVLVRL